MACFVVLNLCGLYCSKKGKQLLSFKFQVSSSRFQVLGIKKIKIECLVSDI